MTRYWAPAVPNGPDAGGGRVATPANDAGVGWGTSEDAFCSPRQGLLSAHSVWSDGDGVYALVTRAASGLALYHNDRTGWRQVLDSPELMGGRVRGFPGGPVLIHGEPTCGIRYVQQARAVCIASVPVVALHVAGPELAYAVRDDHVLVLEAGNWVQLGQPLQADGNLVAARAVWGDSERVLVGAQGAAFLAERKNPAEFIAQDLPHEDFRAAWGQPDGTLWLGTRTGRVFRHDGSWRLEWERGESCHGGIRGFWGHADTLFFYTRNELYRWTARAGIEALAQFPCDDLVRINDLWGNSAREVFVSVVDLTYGESACGETFLVWFDGQQLRQF